MLRHLVLSTALSLLTPALAGGGNPTASAQATAAKWYDAVQTALRTDDLHCRRVSPDLNLQGITFVFPDSDSFYVQNGNFIGFFSVRGDKLHKVWEAIETTTANKNALSGGKYREMIATNSYLKSLGLDKASFKSWCGTPPKQTGRLTRVDWNMGTWLTPRIINP